MLNGDRLEPENPHVACLFSLVILLLLALVGVCTRQSSAQVPQGSPTADPPWAYMGQARPGRTPDIFAEGFVSTQRGMYGTIVFSPDLTEAVWAPEGVSWLLVSRVDGGVWTEPEPLQLLEHYNLTSPVYSSDGERLYFLAGPIGTHGEEDDIWVVRRDGEAWGEPTRLDPAVSAVPKHWQFSLDARGNLYFMGEGAELYRAEYRDGHYAAPQRIPGPINTAAPESSPFISPDSDFMLFDRWSRSSPFIRIMVSFRDASGEWGEPVDMSEVLGTQDNDSCARLSPDGRYLFFQSVRQGSSPSRSIYWVDAAIIESVRPGGDQG